MNGWIGRVAFFWMLAVAAGLAGSGGVRAEDNVEVLAPLETFDNPAANWAVQCGGNVKCAVGARDAGEKKELVFTFSRLNPQQTAAGATWLNMRRTFAAPPHCPGAEGIRVVFSASEEQGAYLGFGVTDRAKKADYALPANATYLISRLGPDKQVALVPFAALKAKNGGPITKPEDILKLTFGGRAPLGTVTIHEVAFYRKRTDNGWLQLQSQTDNPSNLFQRGQALTFLFRLAGEPPAGVSAFCYEVRDYFGAVAATGTMPLAGKQEFAVTLPALPAGYYEVRAYAPDTQGKPQGRSCLKTGFSMQPGVNTFAVLPCTLEENIARIRKAGPENAFFGIQNIMRTQYKLHELLGMPWIMEHPSWYWNERKNPQRQAGKPADWATASIGRRAPLPDYFFGLMAFNTNHLGDIPEWAKSGSDQFPGFRSWDDMCGFLQDSARVNMHVFPAQQKRIYEGAWEIHLNRRPWTTKLLYGPAQVVELMKHVRHAIKAVDPQAEIIGAGFGTFSGAEYFAEMFKLGLLDQLDGISLHCYTQNPEGLGMELAALRKLMRDTVGREVPLYDTECGYTSFQGGQALRLQEQARLNVRQNIVLKGEGVKFHLTFYPFDYGTEGEGTYGLFFYESGVNIGNFGPKTIAPKPAAAALAVCSAQLMDTLPAGKLDWWGGALYGYVFRRGSEPVVTLWSTGEETPLLLPVGDVKAVQVTDIMGRSRELPAAKGQVAVTITKDPVYITGAAAALYLAEGDQGRKVYPGQTAPLQIPAGCTLEGVKVVGAQEKDGLLRVLPDTPAGPVAAMLTLRDKQGKQRAWLNWLLVQSPVELVSSSALLRAGTLGLELRVRNHASYPLSLAMQTAIQNTGAWSKLEGQTLAGGAESVYFLPLSDKAENRDPGKVLPVQIRLDAGKGGKLARNLNMSFLCARKTGDDTKPPAPYADTVHLAGQGAAQTAEGADVRFAWNDRGLEITVTRQDDAHCQPYSGGDLWRGDSIQLAFDTDPDNDNLYNPLAYNFSKKVTEIGATERGGKVQFWRFRTHNQNELALGEIAGATGTWQRNDEAKTSTFTLVIPWKEIGWERGQAGKQLGIAILINDLDAEKGERKCISLFGGINDDKSWRQMGRLTLQ